MSDVSIIISTNANQVGKEIKGMSGDIVGAAAQAKALAKAMSFMDAALNKGKISAAQYSAGIQKLDMAEDALYASIGKTTSVIKQQESAVKTAAVATSSAAASAIRLASSQRMAGKSTNRFGMYAQQVGYQVGDFNVQVQGGANALVAFGQQGTQLAGLIPGLGGAILGIGLSLATAFLRSEEQTKNLSFSFKAMKKDIVDALGPIKPLLDVMGQALSFVADMAMRFGKLLSDNLARVVTYALTAATAFGVHYVRGVIAARAATISFTSSLGLLRGALIRTGIGALIVLAGELVFQFMRLIKAAGGFGAALSLLKDVLVESVSNMVKALPALPIAMKLAATNMNAWFTRELGSMAYRFTKFTWTIADGLNNLFGTSLTGQMGDPITGMLPSQEFNMAAMEMEARAEELRKNLDASLSGSGIVTEKLKELMGLFALDQGGEGIDVRNWFTEGKGDDDKGKAGKDSALEKLLEEQRRRAVLLDLSGQELLLKQEIFKVTDALGDEADSLSKTQIEALAKVNLALTEQETLSEKLLAKWQSVADTIATSMGNAMMSIVDGTMSVKDAFRSMATDIIKQLYQVLVVQQMVGSWNATTKTGSGIAGAIMGAFQADGGAWQGGSQIQAYANGGVVGGPTYFPMAGGKTGLMGEAGPEAIMPLKRGANGKLGVQAEGGSGGVTVIQNNTFGSGVTRAEVNAMLPKMVEATKAAVADAKLRGGSYGGAFA